MDVPTKATCRTCGLYWLVNLTGPFGLSSEGGNLSRVRLLNRLGSSNFGTYFVPVGKSSTDISASSITVRDG